MKVLMLLWDGGGNVPPALSLASRLIRDGHEVAVVAHESLHQRIEDRGLSYLEYQAGYVYDPSSSVDFAESQAAAQQGLIFGPAYHGEAVRQLAELSPDVALVDGMLSYAVKGCLDSGVPTVAMWHTLFSFIAGGPFAPYFDAAMARINQTGQPSAFETYQRMLEAAHNVLVFTYSGFDEASVPVAPNVAHVGPLREAHPPQPRAGSRPFVVVALSSVFTDQASVLNALSAALGTLEVDALITTGSGISPDEISASENVEVQRFVAHDAVLPAADLVVTHGGCGTVMAGLKYGAPMLCLPNNGDQPLIARRLESLGLGRRMDQHDTPAAFASTIAGMLGDTAMRDAAREMAKQLEPHPGMDAAASIVSRTL